MRWWSPKALWRRLMGAAPITIPGPQGELLSKETKRLQMVLSMPAADVAAEMDFTEKGSYADIPHEQMLYRNSRGLLLTSSMIERGVGAGTMMTAASEITDAEADQLRKHLLLLPSRTPFEEQLVRTINSELGAKWV